MNEFLMIFRNEQMDGAEMPSAEQMQGVLQQWQNWIMDVALKGNYSSTSRLLTEGSKTLKPGKVASDGPYVEGKEIVGGYMIVKAENLDQAVEIANECPGLLYGGTVEVRSVMPIDTDAKSATFLQMK